MTTASAGTAQLAARLISGLGTVLVNGQARTLHVFAPDRHAKVTCVGGCASAWPLLKLAY
jgi:predicted lipoprotein with Yx(FWY)xxD motif